VHKLQDEFKLVPLSAYGKSYTPPAGKVDPAIDLKTPVRDQVNRMDAVEYFKKENGWAFTIKTGVYDTDYLMRALPSHYEERHLLPEF